MTVTAYWQTQVDSTIGLPPNTPTVVVQLRLPTTGTFVVWGKVTVQNAETTGARTRQASCL